MRIELGVVFGVAVEGSISPKGSEALEDFDLASQCWRVV